MNKTFLFLLVLCASPANCTEKEFQHTKFKGVKCSSSNKSASAYSCSVKALSRTVTTLNFACAFTKPLNAISLRLSMSYKYGTIYRDVIPLPAIDFCELIGGTTGHPMAMMFFNMAKDYTEFGKERCPLSRVEVKNLTVDVSKLPSIFPMGDYRANLTFFNKEDPKIYQFIVITETTSSIRTSF